MSKSSTNLFLGLLLLGGGLLIVACSQDQRRVTSTACVGKQIPTSRLLLQQVTENSAIIRWRGDSDALCYGTDGAMLATGVSARMVEDHWQVELSELDSDRVYYYSIGGAAAADTDHWFRTAPKSGQLPQDRNVHIWALGDSGTATEASNGTPDHPGEALAVKQGFLRYNREHASDEPLDMVLLLGDNAYPAGSDLQWQGAFFEIYPEIIRNVAVWPTIGNHEMGFGVLDSCMFRPLPDCKEAAAQPPRLVAGVSGSSDPDSYDSNGDGPDPGGLPYLRIFALPSAAEAGGAPSGTEQYYSADFGNVHIVSLDSQLSSRDDQLRQHMQQWLIADLNQNKSDWTIVFFHHPPYSKGVNHDSDQEQTLIDMRESFVPVFDKYGVDVVYSGHSHSYERSWNLHGHTGLSNTFSAALHASIGADGLPALGQSGEPYLQVDIVSNQDDHSVYTVAGSAGKADSLMPCPEGLEIGCTAAHWLLHPAHRDFEANGTDMRLHGIPRRGSVVIDAGPSTLRSRFIDENGIVLDEFIIDRK